MSLTVLLVALLVLVLALIAFQIASSLTGDTPEAELEARWATPPSTWLAVEGLRVHLRDEGPRDDPAPLLLIHGTAASLHTWDGWAEGLRATRRVVRFDLPGFGLTGPRRDADYGIEAYIGFTVALLDALRIERCVLAGNSLGGEIAWGVAARHPERVARLVLIDAAGYAPDWDALPLGFALASVRALRPLVVRTADVKLVARSTRAVYGDPGKVTPALVARYAELMLRPGNRLALTQRLALVKHTLASEVKNVQAPTLLLWGGRDRLIPLRHARRFAQDIAGAELVVFDSLGHVPQEEDPAATLAALRRFLARTATLETPR